MHWARSWSQSLGSQPTGDLSHKPGSRLALLSTRPAVTFPAKEFTLLGQYQIILLGDTGTQVPSQDLNPRSVNHKSAALPIVPLRHRGRAHNFMGPLLYCWILGTKPVSFYNHKCNRPMYPWDMSPPTLEHISTNGIGTSQFFGTALLFFHFLSLQTSLFQT